MIIDCDRCVMQHTATCDDCVVTFILDGPGLELSPTDIDAIGHLADAGLVPPLRLRPRDQDRRTG